VPAGAAMAVAEAAAGVDSDPSKPNNAENRSYNGAYSKTSSNLIIAATIISPKYDVSLISDHGNTFLHDSIQLKNLSLVLFFCILPYLPF
jgi:hypothetical protein